MGYFESIRKLHYIHHLIACEKTGSAKEFGKRIGVCRRTVLHFIDDLRVLGADITYDHRKKSYIYKEHFVFCIEIFLKVVTTDGNTYRRLK